VHHNYLLKRLQLKRLEMRIEKLKKEQVLAQENVNNDPNEKEQELC